MSKPKIKSSIPNILGRAEIVRTFLSFNASITSAPSSFKRMETCAHLWRHRVPNLCPLSIAPDIIRLRSWVQDTDVDTADDDEDLVAASICARE